MTHYRELNKELAEQVQTMRKSIKLYCDEIILLKEELMEKHESEINLRQQCYNWAINNFLQLIQYVQPDSDILPLLKEHLSSQENSRLSSSRSRSTLRSRRSGSRYSGGPRRSSILTTELRRSNSVINVRKTIYNTSPVRRSSNQEGDVDKEQQNSQSIREDTMTEENLSTQTETLTKVVQNAAENIIYDEAEEEEDEEEEIDLGVESVYESVEEDSFEIPKDRCTLKNVTNTLPATKNSLKENSHLKPIRKRGRPQKAKAISSSDEENTTDKNASSMEIEKDDDKDTGLITESYNRRPKLTDKSVMDVEEETLQVTRSNTNSRYASETNKSIPLSQDMNRLYNETCKSPTSFLTDTLLTNFKDAAACSTPNSLRNSLTKGKTPPLNNASAAETSSAVLTVSTNTSTRPSRKCKPKNLTEPTMNTKLRNDSETKTKSKCRTRSRTRK